MLFSALYLRENLTFTKFLPFWRNLCDAFKRMLTNDLAFSQKCSLKPTKRSFTVFYTFVEKSSFSSFLRQPLRCFFHDFCSIYAGTYRVQTAFWVKSINFDPSVSWDMIIKVSHSFGKTVNFWLFLMNLHNFWPFWYNLEIVMKHIS